MEVLEGLHDGVVRKKKPQILMPGVKFGIKYRSAKRHGREQRRRPLRNFTGDQFHLGLNGIVDEDDEEEEEEEDAKREKKPRRLEIRGLVHPDDLTPSRSHNGSSNTTKRRGGEQNEQQQQHTEETGEPKEHYLISLIRKSHRQMYGDPGKRPGQLLESEASGTTPTCPTNTPIQLKQQQQQQFGTPPHHTQDNYGFKHLLDENTIPYLASGRLWKTLGQSGGGGVGVVGRGSVSRGAAAMGDGEVAHRVMDEGARLDGSLSLSRPSSVLQRENVSQWLSQLGVEGGGVEEHQALECEGRGRNGVIGEGTCQGIGNLWGSTEAHNNYNNNDLLFNPYHQHQLTEIHRTKGDRLPTPSNALLPPERPVGEAPVQGFGVGGIDGGGEYPMPLFHLPHQDQGTISGQNLHHSQVHHMADPQMAFPVSNHRDAFIWPPPPPPPLPSLPSQSPLPPPPPLSSHPSLPPTSPQPNPPPPAPFSAVPLHPSSIPPHPPHPPSPRPSSLPQPLLHPQTIPLPPPHPPSSPIPPPPSPLPPLPSTPPAKRTSAPQSSSHPPTQPLPPPPDSSSESAEFTFSPKPSQHQDVWWGATRSSRFHLVAVSHLESNMVFEPKLGWAQQRRTSTHLSGLQSPGNDLGLPHALLAPNDLLNLYSKS